MTEISDLSKLSTEELLKARNAFSGPDLSEIPTDILWQHNVSGYQDIGRGAVEGLRKGVAGTLGLPGDLMRYATEGARAGANFVTDQLGINRLPPDMSPVDFRPGYKEFDELSRKVIDPYHPTTTLGRGAETVGEFVPGALTTAGALRSIPAAIAKYAVLPGATSELAGRATQGTPLEGPARLAGGLIGGAPGMLRDARNVPKSIVSRAMGDVTEAQLSQVQELMAAAQKAGSPLSLPEAVQFVTNRGTGLGDLQRVIEQSSGGGPIMRPFFSERPEANQRMAYSQFDQLGPLSGQPTEVAHQVQQSALNNIDAIRQKINAAAKPYYDSSRTTPIAPADYAKLTDSAAFGVALNDVRSHPILSPTIKDLPDNSIGVLDAVKKHLDDMYSAAMKPTEPQRFLGGEINKGTNATRDVATGAAPDYEKALEIGAQGRQNVLGPAERSPLGQLASAETFDKQKSIIFNPNPLPGSEMQVGHAVATIAKTRPDVANEFVRMKLQQAFDEAAQATRVGANQYGGANFTAIIKGNTQQAKNLEAAVRALPNGQDIWNGMAKMFDIFEAQGTRQMPGSSTDFNRLINTALQGGKPLSEAVAGVTSPSKLVSMGSQIINDIRYGQNTEALARLFVDPNAVAELRRLRMMPSGSPKALLTATALLAPHVARELPSQ